MAGATIKGDAELRRKLAKLKDFSFLAPVVEAQAGEVMKVAQTYPPPRAGSTYIRTGTLRHGWNVESSDLKATIGNAVSYGPWVQSAEQQTWFHAETGWKTDAQIAEEKRESVLDAIKKAVDRHLGS